VDDRSRITCDNYRPKETMKPIINSKLYEECVTVASWFVESQTRYLPIVLVPSDKFPEGLKAINSSRCPIFKVRPYNGPVVLAIPDTEENQ
jgi:hypothetical protein